MNSDRRDEGVEEVRQYHDQSRHRPQGYAPSPGFLDWDSQPNPFRRYVGAPRISLPLVKGFPDGSGDGSPPQTSATMAPSLRDLGLFLELAFGLSAWKLMEGERWSLRNCPSSGNLHPTEVSVLLWQSDDGQALPAGLYHYDPFSHSIECRRRLSDQTVAELCVAYPGMWGCLGLSSIVWREEWKYGARAFRYCQLDVGHAIGAVDAATLAAQVPWKAVVDPRPTDRHLTGLFGWNVKDVYADAEEEMADAMMWLGLSDLPAQHETLFEICSKEQAPWQGTATQVSSERVRWPEILLAERATKKGNDANSALSVGFVGKGPVSARAGDQETCAESALSSRSLGWVTPTLIRQRRSAQRMDPDGTLDGTDFRQILSLLDPVRSPTWWTVFPFAPAIELVAMVHNVRGLASGLYLINRSPRLLSILQDTPGVSLHAEPGFPELYRLDEPTDVRRTASQISCYQGIAGRGAVAWAMVADVDGTLRSEGAWAYRRLHWEAGLIGQFLYLAAEACGLRGTGIGCFMDDESAALLQGYRDESLGRAGIPDRWQTLYHFTLGKPMEDARITSVPAYDHLEDRPWQS